MKKTILILLLIIVSIFSVQFVRAEDTTPEAVIRFNPESKELEIEGIDNVDVECAQEMHVKTCVLEDEGNTLTIKIWQENSKDETRIFARILSLKYNNEEIRPNRNNLQIRLESGYIHQKLHIAKQVRAETYYDENEDRSLIQIKEYREKEQKSEEDGLVLIELRTDKGGLGYDLLIPKPSIAETYFPLKVGNSWTYTNGTEEKTFTIIGTEEINGHTYYKFDDYWGELREGEEYLFRHDGDRVLMWDSWWYSAHGEEVVRYDFTGNDWDGAIYGNCRLKQTGVTCDVPAGEFNNCLNFQFEGTWSGPDAYWYGEYLTPNVGNIRYVIPGGEFPGVGQEGDLVTFELQNYTIIS